MIEFLPLLILVFATFRVTRFFLFDTIIDGIRNRWYSLLLKESGFAPVRFLKEKLLELTSCSWCFGVHVAYLLYAAYTLTWPWDFGINGWLTVAGIAGAAGMIHAYEPE